VSEANQLINDNERTLSSNAKDWLMKEATSTSLRMGRSAPTCVKAHWIEMMSQSDVEIREEGEYLDKLEERQ